MSECARGCGIELGAGPLVLHERSCLMPFTLERVREAMPALRVDEQGCWLWPDVKPRRYPRWGQYQGERAIHRQIASWQAGRPLLHQDYACHTCDQRACVNPAHVYLGTALTNAADAMRNGRTRLWTPERRREIARQRLAQRELHPGITCPACQAFFCPAPFGQRHQRQTCSYVCASASARQARRLITMKEGKA